MGNIAREQFVHLHLHSEYSLLDGALRVKDIPVLAKEMGHTAVALTDHGNMFGAVAFYKACIAAGVKPILGCEVYVAPKSRFYKTYEKEGNYYHLVLLVENAVGYQNLIKLVSDGYLEGFYNKPRVDMELLEKHHEGLICLSACLGGYIPKCLLRGDYAEAKRYAETMDRIFGHGNFFLELQDHGMDVQKSVNRQIKSIARECGIDLVATGDVHYARKKDAYAQAILMCIQTGSTIKDGKPIGFETEEYYYKSTEEMEDLFYDVPEAVTNTAQIAARCQFDFCFDKLYLPVYRTPDGSATGAYLETLAREGFQNKCADGTMVFSPEHPREEYEERMAYELSVICQMGYAEYYLIVWDFIHYAKTHGIAVGPGRGSGAGSLIAYLIDITEVDSIRFGLMFERFLNPERVSMPDFDIDFCDARRGEVIDYVRARYGEDHVAQIITFGTLAARAVVRDVGRVLGMPYATFDAVSKAIPAEHGMTLEKAMELPALKKFCEEDAEIRTLLEVATALEGMPRHASTHAAGVVITDRPVYEYVPLAENSGMPVTQFDMDTVAALGLLKIDFLGLRYLTVMEDAAEQIREREPAFSIEKIPFDDKDTYTLIGQGKTGGVFQLESGGMRNLLTQLSPDSLEVIVAAISLYRPGPMDSIPRFVDNRLHPEKIVYATPLIKDILDVTFGCIVYQEQVMQICRAVAGYSYARADLVRRAMAKKKTDVMERERQAFLYGQKDADGNVIIKGAVANGVAEADAQKLFDDMASFAKYAFNKSHASAYAFTSYRTAYLKRHYPGEYFSALLTSVNGNLNKTAEYIAEAARFHIPILAPDINESAEYFHVSEKNGVQCIRFGLLAIKNVGVTFVKQILAERAERPFTDFEDFVSRMSMRECNKRQVQALVECGAFDALPGRRSQLYAACDHIVDTYMNRARTAVSGQMDLFSAVVPSEEDAEPSRAVGGYKYPDIPEFTRKEKLLLERGATGFCFSGHLLDDYGAHLEKLRPTPILELLQAFSGDAEEDGEATASTAAEVQNAEAARFRDKQTVTVAGMISERTAKTTKKGDTMAFITLEDRYAQIEVLIFPKLLDDCAQLLTPDTAVVVVGEISAREDEEPKILARTVTPLRPDGEPSPYTEAAAVPEVPAPPEVQSFASSESGTRKPAAPVGNGRRTKPRSDTPIPSVPRALYLRVPRISQEEKTYLLAENLAKIFVGSCPVIFYSEETKTYQKDGTLRIALTPYVLNEYEILLGKDNVIVR